MAQSVVADCDGRNESAAGGEGIGERGSRRERHICGAATFMISNGLPRHEEHAFNGR